MRQRPLTGNKNGESMRPNYDCPRSHLQYCSTGLPAITNPKAAHVRPSALLFWCAVTHLSRVLVLYPYIDVLSGKQLGLGPAIERLRCLLLDTFTLRHCDLSTS